MTEWCVHFIWHEGILCGWEYQRDDFDYADDEWNFCPICGKPRPKNKESV